MNFAERGIKARKESPSGSKNYYLKINTGKNPFLELGGMRLRSADGATASWTTAWKTRGGTWRRTVIWRREPAIL